MDDLRIEWIKERVLTFMGETDETIFDDMLQRSGEMKRELDGFLNRDQLFMSDESYRTIIFYKSYVDAIIEEEILVPEVVKKSKTPSRSETRSSQEEVAKKEEPDEEIDKDVKDKGKGKGKGKGKIKSGKKGKTKSEDSESVEATLDETNSAESPGETSSPVTEHEGLKKDDGEAEEDDETKKKKKKKKGKGEGKRKKSGRISPETLVETVPEPEPEPEPVAASELQLGQESPTEPEPEVIMVLKKVEKVIQKPILHALFGRIPKEYDEEGMRCKFVYFLRYYEDGVPNVSSLKEAWQLLPQCILVGTMESDYFIYMNKIIKDLLSPFVEMMYHEPSHVDIKEKIQIKAKVNLQDTELGNISHKTPSYYMDLVVDMDKSAEKRASFIPELPAVHTKQIPERDWSGHLVDFSSNDLVHLTFEKRLESDQAVISDSRPGKVIAKRFMGSMEVDGSNEDEIQRDNAHKYFLLEKLKQIHDIIQWTIDHKEDPDSSVLPYIEVFHDPSTIDLVNSPKDLVIVEQLEKDISTLQASIKDILQTALIQKLTGKEPLDECTFWEERYKTLHTVVEEMKLIQYNVDKIVEVLKIAQSSHGDSYVENTAFFMKNYHEALSNHKFLSSIQRYFETITEFSSFQKVKHAIECVMKKLYLIWILSSYYNKDDTMVSLMERIAYVLLKNVGKFLEIKTLLELPLEEIQFTLEECSDVLMTWKSSYFDVRKMIEEKGRSHRWEFDRNRLFRESEWIRTVCNDLLKITKVLKEFNNIFGAELKSELEDPAHVDAIMDRVYTLLDPIKNSEFDIYDWKFQSNWERQMNLFEEEVRVLELQTEFFITSSLKLLRDSDQAIKLLLKFTQFETRPVIHEELKHKLQYVLQHYKKELLDIENDFQKHKEDPPLDRNRPFFAGSLHWTKGLYSALRKPVLSFQKVPEFHENELRKNVTNDYLEVAAEMKNYMDKKYTVWLDKAIPTVQKSLKRNVLKCMHIHKGRTGEKSRTWESAALQRLLKTSYSVYKMKEKDTNRRTSYASTQSSIPVWKRPPTPVHVTMSQRARATKQPKSLLAGMSLRVALFATRFKRKRSSKFTHSPTYSSEYETHKHDFCTDHGFDDYEIMEWEDTPEMTKFQNFLLNWIEDRKGSRYLPWPSVMKSTILLEYNLRFDVNFNNDLLDTLEEAILMEDLGYSLPIYLHDIVVQKDNVALEHEKISKMVSTYNDLLSGLAKAELCFLKNHLVEIEEKFHRGLVRVNWASLDIDHYIKVCQEDLTSLFNLKKQLHQIADELQARVRLLPTYNLFYVKNPGKGYFRISAKGFFAQLTKYRNEEFIKIVAIYRTIAPMLMKLESLVLQTCTGTSTLMVPYYSVWEAEAYDALLKLCIINIKSFIRFLHTKTAYFRVDTTLNPPNVVLCPSPKGIYNIIMQSVRDFVERFRFFKRWLSTTCIECPPLVKEETGEEYEYTFFEEIMKIPQVIELLTETQKRIQHVVTKVSKTVSRWKRYQNLWLYDKHRITELFASRDPPLRAYDEMFFYYENVIQECKKLDLYIDVNCVRINSIPVIEAIVEHALQWKYQYGSCLAAQAREKMNSFMNYLMNLKSALEVPTDNLEGFRSVLQTIANIHNDSLETEFRFQLIRDSFHTLEIHDIPFPEEELKLANDLPIQWEDLYKAAITRSNRLESTKPKFSALAQSEIDDFVIVCNQFAERFQREGPPSVVEDLDQGLTLMEEFTPVFQEMNKRRFDLVNAEMLFDLPVTDYGDFLLVCKEMEGLEELYKLYRTFKTVRKTWGKTLWMNLNPHLLIKEIDQFLHQFQLLPEDIQKLSTGVALEKNIQQLKFSIPLLVELKNECLRKRHWSELMQKSGHEFNMTVDEFTLENMFAMKLHLCADVVTEIINRATKELAIEIGVREIEDRWNNANLKICLHVTEEDEKGYILGSMEELMQLLENDSMKLQVMAESQYVGPFLNTVQLLEKSLFVVTEVLDEWLCVQKKWLCLEKVFRNDEVCRHLPQATEEFYAIKQTFMKMMKQTSIRKNLIYCCHLPHRLSELKLINDGLNHCQKSLNNFLDIKRSIFPHFFFISNNDLVSILGSNDPTYVRKFMVKMFDSITDIRFHFHENEKVKVVSAIVSSQEEMFLQKECPLENRIEKWMSVLVQETQKTIRFLIKKAIYNYGKLRQPRIEWILGFQGTICLAASQVWWTAEVENAFNLMNQGKSTAMKEYLEVLNRQMDELVIYLKSLLNETHRTKLNMIFITDVHARDIIEIFIRDSVTYPREFHWESQLRYYWMRDEDHLFLKQCTATFQYGYEYIRLNRKIVITPLTNRVYLTFTQALSLHLGGAATGPTGTGKTETIKDLAKALGMLCKVFNCSNCMESRTMSRILSGLVQCGAWGCFTGFNHISTSELSVISTQLQSIRNALMFKADQFMLGNADLVLNRKVGIFITINPIYSDCNELLESVKVHFRPVVMASPNMELICQVNLFCEGYSKAKILAKKITVLYKLAREQFSQQLHYDFGLRALTSFLINAGDLKRCYPEKEEEVLLTQTLMEITVPQLVLEDISVFLRMIGDVFLELNEPNLLQAPNIQLMEAVEQALVDKHYQVLPMQVNKIMQLVDIIKVRHSTMVIGPTGSGKSVIIKILSSVQTKMGLPTKLFQLNPKAYFISEIFGVWNPKTYEWSDGLFSSIFRNINQCSEKKELCFIVFDGDVDALWTETLNSVMDDNKLLTLVNGDHITLQHHCGLLFEVGDLHHASPATISRVGMVYTSYEDLGYSPYWERWVSMREGQEKIKFQSLYQKYIPETMEYILTFKEEMKLVPQSSLNMIVQLCFMLDALVPVREEEEEIPSGRKLSELWFEEVADTNPEKRLSKSTSKESYKEVEGVSIKSEDEGEREHPLCDPLESIFLFAIYWSIGAVLNTSGHILLDEFLKKQSNAKMIKDSLEEKATRMQIPTAMPTLYDYCLNVKEDVWEAWDWLVPEYIHDSKMKVSDVLIPTSDTVRVTWLLNLVNQHFFRRRYGNLKVKSPLLLIGETGIAKTSIVHHFLQKLSPDDYVILHLNFSSRTSSLDVQLDMKAALEERTKSTYGPPRGKHMLCFIDDLNKPQVDQYGTQQPLAMLKHLFEKGGFYEFGKGIIWKNIKDSGFLAAMDITVGRSHCIDPRFMSKFSIFYLISPSDHTIKQIFTAVLQSHLLAQKFDSEVVNIAENVIDATLQLFKIVKTKLLPVPAKFHYIFTLHDISRIISGLCMGSPGHFSKAGDLARLWHNECQRVFMDRLICEEDLFIMRQAVAETSVKVFPQWSDSVLREPLLFGDFRNVLSAPKQRPYEDLLDYDAVYALVREILTKYNENNVILNLVLFDDVLEHFIRVHRVLRMHNGHMTLIGVTSCGKQSITHLAAYTAGHDVFTIQPSYDYNENSLKEDLKSLYKKLAVNSKSVVFLVTASQAFHNDYLWCIEKILKFGIISTLFSEDAKGQLTSAFQAASQEAGFGISNDQVWNYISRKCQNNLHVVLCVSPVGDDFRNCCRSYPSLLNNTTVDWIFTWPDRALTAVATFYLSEDAKIPTLYQPNIVKHMVHVHSSVNKYKEEFFHLHHQKTCVTPKHFHDYIHTYLLLLEEKSASISEKCQLLATTIEKVAEAQTQMNDLQSKIIIQKEAIEQKTKSCEKMMMKIKIATEKITKLNERAEKKNSEIEEKSRSINAEKEDVESILSEALPAFEFACLGIAELDRGDITEIRSLATPPEPLLIVCECVAILRGIKDVSWKAAKGMMADSNFLKSLQETNCELITTHQIRAVKAHMKKTQKLDQMKLISKAGFSMLKFVEAALAYCQVYREARPKKDHVQSMEKERDRMETDLKELTQEIEMAKLELKKFANKYDGTVKDRKKLQQEMDLMLHCLSIAEKLVAGLEMEKTKWSSNLQSLREKKKCLIGDCLLTAAFLSYVGPFTEEYRNRMLIEDWVHDLMQYSIPLTNPYSLEGLLLDNAQTVRWSAEGLPQDQISIQNAILTIYSRRFPLCLDPQEQAVNWIKRREEENNLKILTFSDCDFLKKLEVAVTLGTPVMFEDIEEYVDPLVYSLLEKSTRVTNGQTVIKLGDKEVEYNSNFQLYLVTKLTNPEFEPAIYSKANIINFTITNSGLEEQLLTIVVQHEHPDVEIRRNSLIRDINSNKSLLKNLKANLLDKVANAPSYILDDVDLLNTLEETKLQVDDTSDKIQQATQAAKDIDYFRNDYRVLAEHGSILFSVVSNMVTVDTMYKYSLTSFKNRFYLSLQKAVQDNQLEVRLKNVINTLTKFVYDYVCIGVYQRHKILFSFQLALTLEKNKKQVSQEQIKFFIWGNQSMSESTENPAEWITSQIWKDILFLSSCFPSFSSLSDDVRQNLPTWKKWFDHNTPESVQYPMNYRKKLTPFECLMLLRCFRYDRVYPALLIYISKVMGLLYVTPHVISHSEIRSYASSTVPVLFILSSGSDPIDELMKQARLCGSGSRFRYLSMGYGQENHALYMIKIAMQRGQWLLLQNCHLLINFARDLIKEIEKMGIPHSDFRLWMTTKSTSNFPTSLLQSSLKVVFESPNSVKKNIQKTFVNLAADTLDICEHPAFKPVFYVISFFHAVLQERSNYGKFGWNLCYDFNEHDFGVCTQILTTYLRSSLEENSGKIMWEGLKYLIGKVIYGGKVNDIYDQSIIQMYLDQYIGDFLFESSDTFYFYKDQNIAYLLPSVNSYEDYIASIDKLPFTTNPEVLGLNSNSEIIYNKKLFKEFEYHLQKLQPQQQADGCIEILDEKLTADIIMDIMGKVPEIYDIKKIMETQADGSEQTPMFVVLVQELERFNALITCMHKTLQALQKALGGELRMEKEMEEMSWSLVQGHLPTAWQKLTPPTCKLLGSWLEHFEKRVIQYTNWIDCGEPCVLWISGLHVPKCYLAAVMQIACHKYLWPLDDLTLLISCTSWKKREEIIPDDDSCTRYLQGLYLNGAHWSTSKNCLMPSKTRILIEELPFLKVKVIKHQSLKLVNTLRIPVYATSRRRRNHIDESSEFEIVLGIEKHKSHWILQNVCILLNED